MRFRNNIKTFDDFYNMDPWNHWFCNNIDERKLELDGKSECQIYGPYSSKSDHYKERLLVDFRIKDNKLLSDVIDIEFGEENYLYMKESDFYKYSDLILLGKQILCKLNKKNFFLIDDIDKNIFYNFFEYNCNFYRFMNLELVDKDDKTLLNNNLCNYSKKLYKIEWDDLLNFSVEKEGYDKLVNISNKLIKEYNIICPFIALNILELEERKILINFIDILRKNNKELDENANDIERVFSNSLLYCDCIREQNIFFDMESFLDDF